MDKHDFDGAGLSNHAFVDAMRQNFGPPRKGPPEPHYIYTAQAPTDKPDRGFEKDGLASIIICIILPLLGIGMTLLHLHYGFPF